MVCNVTFDNAAPHYGSAPVSSQPTTQQGNPPSLQIMSLNVPPGLQCLAQLSGLKVMQTVELWEAICAYEVKNKYIVTDSQGGSLFSAREDDTDCCTRNYCGNIRPFDMKIKNDIDEEIIHIVRPLACQGCCFPGCLQSLEVYAPPGRLVGIVEQEWSFLAPRLVVRDADRNVVLRIEGPVHFGYCCGDNVDFKVMLEDGSTQIGKISKFGTAGLCHEVIAGCDNFEMSFPVDLNVKKKAVLLGALILIDFMYF